LTATIASINGLIENIRYVEIVSIEADLLATNITGALGGVAAQCGAGL